MTILITLLHLFLPLSFQPEALVLFRQWSKSPSAELRVQAIRTLRGHGGREPRAALLSMLADAHPAVLAAAREELGRLPPDDGPDLAADVAALRQLRARIEGLRVVLERREDATLFCADRAPEVRRRAIASGRIDTACIREALHDKDPLTRAIALEGLPDPETARAFGRDRADPPRIAAARATSEPDTVTALLRDRSWRVRLAAVRATERIRESGTVPALIELLRKEKPGRLRARVATALENLTQVPFGDDARRWKRWWGKQAAGYTLPPQRGPARHGTTTASVTFRRIPVVSRRLCFILDASRSMSRPAPGADGKSRWDLVVRDLGEVVRRLPAGTRFNVIVFRTEIEAWRKRLVNATTGARRACREWVENTKPSGWTNLFDALEVALRDDDVDTVYVLTDGVPSRGRETKRGAILAEIARLNRYRLVQINCVQAGAGKGLGRDWRGFLDELAQAHEGVSVRE